MSPAKHPEWAGYLAAFDTYVDARARGDDEHAEQARLLMGHFAGGLLEERFGANPRVQSHLAHDLTDILAQAGIDVNGSQ